MFEIQINFRSRAKNFNSGRKKYSNARILKENETKTNLFLNVPKHIDYTEQYSLSVLASRTDLKNTIFFSETRQTSKANKMIRMLFQVPMYEHTK